jgi:hypothetical protein
LKTPKEGTIASVERRLTTNPSEYEEEEKDQVMPLDGANVNRRNIDNMIVVKEDSELFSNLALIDPNEDPKARTALSKSALSR